MCGVTGYINLNGEPASKLIIKNMIDLISHRGPDDTGSYISDTVGLGHARLSIIDLSEAGRQPMETRDKRFVISYNGEVYNFKELRKDLESLGCNFKSHTDSEVVLYAFAVWGLSAIKKFNGMFAFAIWDKDKKKLYLVRDRFGVKPLYYYYSKSCLIFASESKSFLAHPNYKPEVCKYGLLEYITFQNYFTSRTLFKNVNLIPPGNILCFDYLKNSIELNPYWDFKFDESLKNYNIEDLEEELDFLFSQSVNRQLIADVNVGAYLSGGIDSGAITAIASKKIKNMNTFTVGFDLNSASGIELAYDERENAKHMAKIFETNHNEVVLRSGDMENAMKKLIWHLDEPRVGQCYPNFYASELASSHSKVVLAGTGGDELFGGYPWRYYRGAISSNFKEYLENYFEFWQRLVPPSKYSKMLMPLKDFSDRVDIKKIFFDIFSLEINKIDRPEDYINYSLYLESKTFLHGLLVIEDKLSMAHSLEARVPFLDNDLVNFAMSLPVNVKLDNLHNVVKMNENEPGKVEQYFQKTKDGKLILRKVMEKYVPNEVSNRQKQGFSGPDASWFRGESIDYVRDTLLNNNAKIYDFFDKQTVLALLEDHLSGRNNRRLLIWSLLSLETWHDIFINGSWKVGKI
ncbi:MAG: Asparagine synthetase [glutamine-hydrolyzing] 1 [Alphaproteobacteria bacterium MarineAlpha2_Bin1]|nr:MAG: Asparagine synthetase [glutamine-hydrolyzing] 1 [Alphaproteobacteria bacterium MarineAlpha2_Bin1]